MALLDRVATLLRANLNDLVERAEQPEKLLKQLLLDMENQLLQVKTQVAMAIAEQHVLEKKAEENRAAQQDWMRKADVALRKAEEELARVALERSLTHENAVHNFAQQLEDQTHQVRTLRDALHRLEAKMAETKAKADILIAQHRRAALNRQAGAQMFHEFRQEAALGRVQDKVLLSQTLGQGQLAASKTVEDHLERLEKADRVDRLLAELKNRIAGT